LTDSVGQDTAGLVARRIPDDRIEQLVDCATHVFIEQGYARTQMADVAAALGVGKGTIYLYVESKEALFDLVARFVDVDRPFSKWPPLPVRTPKAGATLKYVRERLAENAAVPSLAQALSKQRVTDVRAELHAIVRELYDTVARNRRGIKLLDRSARDYPELAALWFESGRGGLISLLTKYLDDRMRRKLLRPLPDAAVAARLLIETVVFWAVHRHWDPHPQVVDEAVAKDTVVAFVTQALLKE
jgi:AcrR family transcriptional regulator